MKNYVQPGDQMTLTAPYDVAAGAGLLVGTQFGLAVSAALSGATVEVMTEGIFDVAKADSQAWTMGAAIYWDNTNKVFTTSSSGNTLVATAVLAVANTAGLTTGRVRLKGV